ncbi:MAG: N-acetylmuramoyl-L-alanine amidase, partial [Bacteroidales bacterium]|nr:N-acetylmuramoyl-L-alanine amidase [Bacteroidales bacterium]
MKIMIVVKRVFAFFGIVALVFLPLHDAFADGEGRIRKVVIDAGHGGRDPGALGKNSREKDIALSIALKTGGYIEKYLPDVEVIYTRKSDRFVELHKRAQIANEAQADLFISIHCNANNSSQPYGTETYVMGLHKSQANLEVAQKENAAILKEEDYQAEYEGFDPESPEAYIIFSLFQNAFLDQSLEFASLVQNQFKERVGLRDRGVMQAGFLVLYRITMPG